MQTKRQTKKARKIKRAGHFISLSRIRTRGFFVVVNMVFRDIDGSLVLTALLERSILDCV